MLIFFKDRYRKFTFDKTPSNCYSCPNHQIKYSYPERWRDRPSETSATRHCGSEDAARSAQGANSGRQVLEDERKLDVAFLFKPAWEFPLGILGYKQAIINSKALSSIWREGFFLF